MRTEGERGGLRLFTRKETVGNERERWKAGTDGWRATPGRKDCSW